MTKFILKIYAVFSQRKFMRRVLFLFLTAALIALSLTQKYREDILDFLPLDENYRKAMKVYQEISGADKIVGIFSIKDTSQTAPEIITAAIEDFEASLQKNDSAKLVKNLTLGVDLERLEELKNYVYDNIPYFLSEKDYEEFDSLLKTEDFINRKISEIKKSLLSAFSDFSAQDFQKDPLGFFSPKTAELLQGVQETDCEIFDGRIFSPDMSFAVITLTSPYGSAESGNNAKLLSVLEKSAHEAMQNFPQTEIVFTGGPVIAVGNSSRIQTDSVLTAALAMVLIIVLLVRSFKSLKNILLIVLSVSWGWLFAFGILSLVHDSISVIVIGISSVILGIAVNYPLHFVSHLYHTPDVKTALKELVVPLVVGNITTVGAFAALVPADSAALRDLGLFSALLLVGTIIFVLVFMPHFTVAKTENTDRKKNFPDFSPEKSRITVGAVLILTPVLLYFSFGVKFDADFSHINYMTETQKNALKKLQNIVPEVSAAQNVYAVSTGKTFDEAYTNSAEISSQISSLNADKVLSCRTFLTDSQTQKHRLEKWRAFVSGHFSSLKSQIETAAQKEGFAEGTFDDFFQILENDYPEKKVEEFAPLTKSVFRQNVIFDTLKNECSIIDILSPKEKNFTEKAAEKLDGVYVFDVKSLNSQVAENLSDDFNYIGWACSLIVFCFLWFSFGSIELALLSFLPMAVSWIWILGLMSLFDIQFNLVNIILATFIFGQGDDYTIFITEGCQREYALRKKMLPAYKESIMTSALIMFAGIGVLIFAKHPALFSLAEVTIAGMFSVVLTAYIFPPLIFRFLTSRQRPLTLKSLFSRRNSPLDIVLDVYRYRGIEIFSPAKKRLKSFITPVTDKQVIAVKNCKTGEIPLFLALMFPEKKILGFDLEKENLSIAEIAAENIADNVSFFSEKDFEKVIKGLSENDAEIIEIV